MEIKEINIENYLTTDEYNPSPHRFNTNEKPLSERKIPLIYKCENCEYSISFRPEDFEKHYKTEWTNLSQKDKVVFEKFRVNQPIENYSFLDFYCAKCKQATIFIFDGGASGYWGNFEFKIKKVLVIKP